jgi:hypothetical protein
MGYLHKSEGKVAAIIFHRLAEAGDRECLARWATSQNVNLAKG